MDARDGRADNGRQRTGHDEPGQQAGPRDAARVVIGIDRHDTPHSLGQIGRGAEGERRAHRLAEQRHVAQVESGDEVLDRFAHGRLLIGGARHDLRVAHSREIEGIHRVPILDQRDEVTEVLGLGAHGVQQDQRWPHSTREIAQSPQAFLA